MTDVCAVQIVLFYHGFILWKSENYDDKSQDKGKVKKERFNRKKRGN